MAKKYQASEMTAKWENWGTLLCGGGFFLTVCLSSVSSAKVTALLCLALAAVTGILFFSRLRERLNLPMVAIALFTVMGGISTFYAVAGKFALREFLKLFISFFLAIAMLALVKGDKLRSGRWIASILSWGAALSGIVSIDMLSTHWISGLVIGFLGAFTDSDYANLPGVEAGVRMTSLFQNPNVFAACVCIGVLLSLGLALSARSDKERRGHLVCLYINALAFVLAFSMGAIAFAAVAFLTYLILEQKERRAALFILMVETLVATLAGMIPIAMTALDTWNGFQPIPLICLALGAVLLCLLDRLVGQKIVPALEQHSRILFAIIAAAVAGILAFALLAYNLTGSASLSAGESLRRSAYPEAGTYTLDIQSSGAVNVTVTTQNKQETMMHTETTLYEGDGASASFTVPEDSMVVWFTFTAPNGAVLDTVTCRGASDTSVPLGYKLLPAFIANRLQGLFANQNAIQRTVFFEDGLKIFARSPIFGLGLGSYENGIMSVQSFFYETKYAHNHYIQTLAETGVIGLVLFLALLGISAAAVLLERRKKENAHPLTAALGATLIFMAGHAAMEVDFSYYAYLPFAFGVFALISLCCGETVTPKLFSEKPRGYFMAVMAVLTAVFTFFLARNMSAADLIAKNATYDNLERAAKMDKFECNDYMLSYVYASTSSENEHIRETAAKFAEKLAKVDSNSIPIYLAQYYFELEDHDHAFAMIEKYVRYVISDSDSWNQAFGIMMNYDDGTESYRVGAAAIGNILTQWSEENMGSVTLDESNQFYLLSLSVERD